MRIFLKLLAPAALVAAAVYAYVRFVAGPAEGREETERAEPFSSEDLGQAGGEDLGQAGGETPAGPEAVAEEKPEPGANAGESGDTLTQPTWLKPADADAPDASVAAGGDTA
jgi:hypothetical protein